MEVTRDQARDMAEAHAEGMHDDAPREGCPDCEDRDLASYPEDFPENKPVSVDPGDLLEVCQAANAWAGYLRERYPGSGPTSRTVRSQFQETADRIDQAARRLREAAA